MLPRTTELVLGKAPDAARSARRFVSSALQDQDRGLVADAELIVTELVTNACLHGEEPIVVRVTALDNGARLEVQDGGRTVPVQLRGEGMTGRGLHLVGSVSSSWGVDLGEDGGKVVWAHLLPPAPGERSSAVGQVDVEALLSAWEEEDGEPRYEVLLGAVPTRLLVEAKAHIDNVVRELTFMRSEGTAGRRQMPAPLAALVRTVTEDFAEARADIKLQAVRAAARGDDFTNLVLNLPASAADAAERYLDALEQADRHARAARLLTVVPPPSHRAFRRWYLHSLIDQLRAAARGDEPPVTESFFEVLAGEVDRLALLEQSWERLELMHSVNSRLSTSVTVQEMADAVVDTTSMYRGVAAVRVYVLTDNRTLKMISWKPASAAEIYAEIPLDADLPGPSAVRTGEPIFLRSVEQVHENFPALQGYDEGDRSLHVVPLMFGQRALGLLSVSFFAGELAEEDQLTFVRSVAAALSQAVQRAVAVDRTERERERELQLLIAQLEVLSGTVAGRPLTETLSNLLLAVEAVSSEGMIGSVLLMDDDGVHLRHGAAPSLPDAYNEAIDGLEIGPAAGSCGTAAYLREQVIVDDVDTDPRWEDYRELAALARVRSCWSTPIIGRNEKLIGTFAMYYPRPHVPGPTDQALIDVLVRTVALAIERSRYDEERAGALAAERSVALTLQHGLMPSVPDHIGPVRLEARYRTGDPGVEVGGDWFDAIDVPSGVVLVVGDVQGHDLRAATMMGQLQTVARAYAGEGQSPGEILARVHRYLERIDGELLTTMVVAKIDNSASTVTVASAGHLPPLLLRPGDEGRWLASDLDTAVGPPLTIGEEWTDRASDIPPGAMLVLYTDGLVESRAWPIGHGLEILHKVMESLPLDTDLGTVIDSALELVPYGSRGDDVAVLVAVPRAGDGPSGR